MRRIAASIICLLWTGAASAQQAADTIAPEIATGIESSSAVRSQNWMVAAANPLAAVAGADILRAGGNAIDAMVAVQAVLGLVEPQSSGLGGGAFLVYWDAKTRRLTTFDARETAPMAATPRLFLKEDGTPMGFMEAVVGGRSVGVPGTPRLLETAHRAYGQLAWGRLFDRAIALGDEGFEVSPGSRRRSPPTGPGSAVTAPRAPIFSAAAMPRSRRVTC